MIPLFAAAPLSGDEARATVDPSCQVDVRVRFTFTGDRPRRFRVRVQIVNDTGEESTDGRISEIENHCSAPVSTGALRLSEDQRAILIEPRLAMSDGAVEFRIQAARHTKLAITVGDAKTSGEVSLVALNEILDGREITSDDVANSDDSKDSDGPTRGENHPSIADWSLQRIAGDQLRVDFENRSSYLIAQSQFSFSVHCNSMVTFASHSLTLRYQLHHVGSGKVVSEKSWPLAIDASGDTEPILVAETTPANPGVYEVRCFLEKIDDNIWSRLRRRDPPLVMVGRPIMVPAKDEPNRSAIAGKSWRTVGEIRPSQTAAWSVSQWLPAGTNRLIPGSDPPHDLMADRHGDEDISVIPPSGDFQATVPVMTPGLPHKVTLRYPAGRSMRLRVDVAPVAKVDDPDLSFVLVHDKAARTESPWCSHTFVHYPRSGDQIRLTNLDSSESVAFESIKVDAGPDHLTNREPTGDDPRVAAFQLKGFDWVDSLSDDVLRDSVNSCQSETIALYRIWIAVDRLRDHVVANGMNAVSIPAISQGRAWLPSESFAALRSGGQWDETALETCLALLDHSNLKVFLGVDVSTPLTEVESLIREQPGAAEPLLADDRNRDGVHRSRYNDLHPVVRDAVAGVVGEVDRMARTHRCYAGIALRVNRSGLVQAIGDEMIDDSTLALFKSVSGTDTLSMPQLRSWIDQEGKAVFQQWRNSQIDQLLERLAGSVTDKPLLLQTEQSHDEIVQSNMMVASSLNCISVRNVCRASVGSLSHRIRFQQLLSAAGIPAAKAGRVDVVNFCNSQPIDSPGSPVMGDHSVTDIQRLIDRHDPTILLIQSTETAEGMSAAMTQALAAFTALPIEPMVVVEPADPAAQVVRVRSRMHRGRLVLTVANHAPWSSEVDLDCSQQIDWQWADGSEFSDGDGLMIKSDGPRLTVTLPAGRSMLLRSKQPLTSASVKSWVSRPSGGRPSLDEIKKDVSAIVARLGILSDLRSYPVLSNGGFEQQGGMGLVGWLHAQHPPDAVRVDQQESIEGSRSVLLTTGEQFSSRTWLVSETFSPPESGRLAISLACRGELSRGDTVHRIRVSIEGTRQGEPLRQSSEFDIPRDGKWQARKVVLEVDGIEPATVHSLRLTLDSLSTGRVWIDDVHLHDWFPLAKERSELQSQAFLAVQGLQRGNLTPSARLLQNHWAQFLLTEGASRQPPPVIEATEIRDEPPGVAERIRNWLPRPLRF